MGFTYVPDDLVSECQLPWTQIVLCIHQDHVGLRALRRDPLFFTIVPLHNRFIVPFLSIV